MVCASPLVARTGAECDLRRETASARVVDVDTRFSTVDVDTSPSSRRTGRSPSTRVEGVCGSALSPLTNSRGVFGSGAASRSVCASAAGIRHSPCVDAACGGPSQCRRHGCRASIAALSFPARPSRVPRWQLPAQDMVGCGPPAAASRRVAALYQPRATVVERSNASARAGAPDAGGRQSVCRLGAALSFSNFPSNPISR